MGAFHLIILLSLLFVTNAEAQGLTMAAEEDYFPYSAKVDGELTGLIPELTQASFDAVGVEVNFIVRPYSRVLKIVEDGQAIGGFTGAIDDSNRDTFHWHKTPLTTVRLAIWGRTDASRKGLTTRDMEGEKISITRGFFYTDAIDYNDQVEKLVAPSDASSLRMLALGRSDYALVTELIGRKIVETSPLFDLDNRIDIVGLIDEVPLHAFFSREHPEGKEIANLFQKGLEIILANGEYQRILDRWL